MLPGVQARWKGCEEFGCVKEERIGAHGRSQRRRYPEIGQVQCSNGLDGGSLGGLLDCHYDMRIQRVMQRVTFLHSPPNLLLGVCSTASSQPRCHPFPNVPGEGGVGKALSPPISIPTPPRSDGIQSTSPVKPPSAVKVSIMSPKYCM